jgi:hypothetical protein
MNVSLRCRPCNVEIQVRIMRSKDPASLISSAHNNVHFLTLYLHFPKCYPTSNVTLPEGPAGIACEPSKLGHSHLLNYNISYYYTPSPCRSRYSPFFTVSSQFYCESIFMYGYKSSMVIRLRYISIF